MRLSNCLIEALKAKLKDPKHVQLIFIWPKLNHGRFHVMWVDRKQDKIFHAHFLNADKVSRFHILYQPDFKSKSFRAFQGWYATLLVNNYGVEKAIKIFKKKNFPLINIKGVLDYGENDSCLKAGPELPKESDLEGMFLCGNYVVIVESKDGERSLRSMKTSEAVKYAAAGHEFLWKYVTPFDNNYGSVGKITFNTLF